MSVAGLGSSERSSPRTDYVRPIGIRWRRLRQDFQRFRHLLWRKRRLLGKRGNDAGGLMRSGKDGGGQMIRGKGGTSLRGIKP